MTEVLALMDTAVGSSALGGSERRTVEVSLFGGQQGMVRRQNRPDQEAEKGNSSTEPANTERTSSSEAPSSLEKASSDDSERISERTKQMLLAIGSSSSVKQMSVAVSGEDDDEKLTRETPRNNAKQTREDTSDPAVMISTPSSASRCRVNVSLFGSQSTDYQHHIRTDLMKQNESFREEDSEQTSQDCDDVLAHGFPSTALRGHGMRKKIAQEIERAQVQRSKEAQIRLQQPDAYFGRQSVDIGRRHVDEVIIDSILGIH